MILVRKHNVFSFSDAILSFKSYVLKRQNELGKIDKMRGLASILFFSATSLKINNTWTRMLDSFFIIWHSIILKSCFWHEIVRILPCA